MAIYLFSQILKITIKLIEKLSRQHLINSSDVFVIKGFTVVKNAWEQRMFNNHAKTGLDIKNTCGYI